MNDQGEQDDLRTIAPTLHRLKGGEPFVVPESFFDRFPHTVQTRVVARGDHRWRSILAPWTWRLAAAGMAAVLVVFSIHLFRTSEGTTHSAPSMVHHTDAEEQLLHQWTDLEVMELLATTDGAVWEPGSGFTPTELERYLEHEELDIDLLIETL
jgi:hypothetical protein